MQLDSNGGLAIADDNAQGKCAAIEGIIKVNMKNGTEID